MHELRPMDAVAALYSDRDRELAQAIVASLSHAVFERDEVKPAGPIKRAMANGSYRILQWTTRTGTGRDETGGEAPRFSNSLLKRSRHPYARSLLTSSRNETESLVEGGDPMNGPYMMLVPEIRKNCSLWDRLLLDSVQGRDVQARFVWETRATYEAARSRLERDEPVRLKAVAAGTGLSMILAYDKLVREGFNPELITTSITDREPHTIDKANCLLSKLDSTRERMRSVDAGYGIAAVTEDIFPRLGEGSVATGPRYDVVTAIGILEYFQGFSYSTTEQKLKIEPPIESTTAQDLAARLDDMTTERASLIVNTYMDDASTRILELFGKRFDYRNRENLRSLLASVNFGSARLAGSGNIYDVETYEKNCPSGDGAAPTANLGMDPSHPS